MLDPDISTNAQIAAFVYLGIAILIFLGSIIWVYYDANARGKSGCCIAAMVLVFAWPLSIIVWIASRPEKKNRLTPKA